jgi:hypothetical protein
MPGASVKWSVSALTVCWVRAVGLTRMQKSGDFSGLFDAFGGEFACVVGRAIYRFRVPPQNQIHYTSNITFYFSAYTVYTVCTTLI